MTTTFAARIAGPVLSSLLFEFATTKPQLHGLLFGSIRKRAITTFRDDCEYVHDEIIVHVESFQVVESDYGLPNFSALTKAEVPAHAQVVGWFVARHQATLLLPTILEKTLHTELLAHFRPSTSSSSSSSGAPAAPFVMGLFTGKLSDTQAVHSFDYVLLRHVTAPPSEIRHSFKTIQPPFVAFDTTTPVFDALSHREYRMPSVEVRQAKRADLALLPELLSDDPSTPTPPASSVEVLVTSSTLGACDQHHLLPHPPSKEQHSIFGPGSSQTAQNGNMNHMMNAMIQRIQGLCQEVSSTNAAVSELENRLAEKKAAAAARYQSHAATITFDHSSSLPYEAQTPLGVAYD
ncbi:hypothetical protein CAOG_07962 [Capsaspora owczarzaki ATCC 30864]|uniref:MPN domain-containing protein n=1 Tax=Capsaspora owczarzaki (strain ATCC 30864) TaxID=595528 RepID=A0A0D2WYB5_CAPO3|nr:hypothetical protein CAOG_07962 [Capsaspora owczarzaki ATCC 30864]KJE97883.1 hypothetical protein CAOG_007962 [Capsaspora owczarzaki ATCC 30864]|eukprot:XP_004343050.1 hypothetical protein CAOG_07962 [Capsaspora owczarzaki ATCC 30864]